MKDQGEEIIIKGRLYRDGETPKRGDIYSSESTNKRSSFETISTETVSQSSQTVIQAAVTQAHNIGASGLVAMSSGAFFQINAINDNVKEAQQIAQPLYNELVETGTIIPPEGSKYQFVEVPVTESFFGKKVGEAKRRQDAYDKLTPEQKALQDEFKKSLNPTSPSNLKAAERNASSI